MRDGGRGTGDARRATADATYERALVMLTVRARSVRDLRTRLLTKGEEPQRVDSVIARLLDNGLLDDAALARQIVRAKAPAGISKQRLRQELFRRGVPRELAEPAIDEVWAEEEVDPTAAIEALARKKIAMLRNVDVATRSRRLYAFLARRGYDAAAIKRAVMVVESGA